MSNAAWWTCCDCKHRQVGPVRSRWHPPAARECRALPARVRSSTGCRRRFRPAQRSSSPWSRRCWSPTARCPLRRASSSSTPASGRNFSRCRRSSADNWRIGRGAASSRPNFPIRSGSKPPLWTPGRHFALPPTRSMLPCVRGPRGLRPRVCGWWKRPFASLLRAAESWSRNSSSRQKDSRIACSSYPRAVSLSGCNSTVMRRWRGRSIQGRGRFNLVPPISLRSSK